MAPYDPKQALISLHIFKTGGTSLMRCLSEWFGKGYFLHYLDHETGRKPYLIPWNEPHWHAVHNPDQLPVCIHGHFDKRAGIGVEDYYPNHRQIITLFRDPVEAHLSAYYFQKKKFEKGDLYYHGQKLEEFPFKDLDYFFNHFRSFLLDDFPWDLNLDNFKDVLSQRFVHIGLTENLQNSCDKFARLLGLPPKSISRENATERNANDRPEEKSIREFIEKNPLEHAIFEWVKQMN